MNTDLPKRFLRTSFSGASVFYRLLKSGSALYLFCLVFSEKAFAQDPQFSQYYAAPLYLSPAFAGSEGGQRFCLSYRNQWTTLPGSYATFAGSFDMFSQKLRSGFGVLFTNDNSGNNNLTSSSVAAAYNYHMPLNKTWQMVSAIQLGLTSKTYNFGSLTFGDQIQQDGIIHATKENLSGGSVNIIYPDITFGVMVHNGIFWAAASAKHLNQPEQTIITSAYNQLAPILTVNMGITLPLIDPRRFLRDEEFPTWSPSLLFKQQNGFTQIDVGASFNLVPIVVGAYYRGMPYAGYSGYFNRDSFIAMVGFTVDAFRVGYSYDVPVSYVAPIYGGAHEITAAYLLHNPKLSKKKKYFESMPCPKF